MPIDHLPNEIVNSIFLTLPDISSVLALASTSHYFHGVYHGSQRLAILTAAADAEYGPIDDILQICTYNASQPAHIHRSVPMSDALIKQVLKIGRTAAQWEEVYPFKKWKNDYANRRLITPTERFKFRRAMYRLWLFTRAFHTRAYPRTSRNVPQTMQDRAALLHNWSTAQLAEMLDVHTILRDVISNNICPSNGKIRQKFAKRYPESNHQLLFNIHLNYPPPSASWCATDGWFDRSLISSAKYHQIHSARLQPSRYHEPGAEGWGDDINHYYIVEDMLKLDPRQLLFLRDKCPLKTHVELWLRGNLEGGTEWFVNNGESFCETVWHVVKQRGGEVDAFKAAVEEGEMGVAVTEEE